MTLERIVCADRDEWLRKRFTGIGGSEAASVVGLNPWQTPLDLWRIKTGASKAKDLSGNAAVEQGIRMEPALRTMFAALHPEFEVEYHQYDLLRQKERPWLFATLDGELATAAGRRGILEIKTATPNGRAGWAKWSDGKLPANYYAQTLHQLLATGFDFVFLFAALYSMSGDITLREYEVDRADSEADLKWLLVREERFWNENIVGGVMPAQPLTL